MSLALGVAFAGILALLVLMGPVGWIVAAFVAFGLALLAKWSGSLGGGSVQPSVNCPGCGAPNDPDSESCEYCGEALPGTDRSTRDRN